MQSVIRMLCLICFFVTPRMHGEQVPETWITVFVHGIMIIKPYWVLGNVFQLMTDDVHNTLYALTLENMRNDSFFYQNQAMQELGLRPVSSEIEHGNASGALAYAYDAVDRMVHGDCRHNYFYTFGWAALLSHGQRYADAQILYTQLVREIEAFRAQGITPKVRVIGYSHGGNVCLNMAGLPETQETISFVIDELILLGMPVQPETAYNIQHSLFKKIYHFYSMCERLQPLDFFSFNRFFSRRLFKPCYTQPGSDKIYQLKIRVGRTTKTHCLKTHARCGNFDDVRVLAGNAPFLRNTSPGHTELWFFSWTPKNYRGIFPLNPLPVVALTPLLIDEVRLFEEMTGTKPDVLDIRPQYYTVLVKNKKNKIIHVRPSLTQDIFERLRTEVKQYAPIRYNQELYNEHIWRAYDKAYTERPERLAGVK